MHQIKRSFSMQYPKLPWWNNGVPAIEWPVYAGYDSSGTGIGDFRGFTKRVLPLIKWLRYDKVWLPPFYPSGGADRGYDITDHMNVDPLYGTLEDFRHLVKTAHSLGIKVIIDLVPGHTSRQHPFFLSSRSNPSGPFAGYYIWDPKGERNAYYYENGVRREVRNMLIVDDTRKVMADDGIETVTHCWHWDSIREEYYWHRFKVEQPALNFRNPAVIRYMDEVILFWAGLGVDGFRIDAVPFLFEQDKTACEDLPEVHDWIRHVRQLLNERYPGTFLLCESDLPLPQLSEYIREDEFNAGFDFRARVSMMRAMAEQDTASIEAILTMRPPMTSTNLVMFTHLSNHDDLRLYWELAAVQQFMLAHYGDGTRGEAYLSDAVVGDLAPLLDWDRHKIEQIDDIRASLPGVHMDYYRQIIDMGHFYLSSKRFVKPEDLRDLVRTPPHWDDSPNAGFSKAHPRDLYLPVVEGGRGDYRIINIAAQRDDPRSPLNARRRLNNLLRREPLLAFGHAEVLPKQHKWELGIVRWWPEVNRSVIGIHNLHPTKESAFVTHLPSYPHFQQFQGAAVLDLASGRRVGRLGGRGGLRLEMPLKPQTSWLLSIVPNS